MELGLRAFEAEDLMALSAAALAASLGEERRAIDRLEADFSRRLARFDATHGFEPSGALDTIAWLKQHARLSGGAAAERVKVATKLAELPVMAKAFTDGELSFGQAAVVARAAEGVGKESAAEMEQQAVAAARELDPTRLRQFTDRLACELNQEAFLADHTRAHERRRLDLPGTRTHSVDRAGELPGSGQFPRPRPGDESAPRGNPRRSGADGRRFLGST